jgi:hypothetical protein
MLNIRDSMAAPTIDEITTEEINTKVGKNVYPCIITYDIFRKNQYRHTWEMWMILMMMMMTMMVFK